MKTAHLAPFALLLVAAGVIPASAQAPSIGIVACERCTAPVVLPTAALFGFHVSNGDLDAVPDVLYDERQVGGGRIGFADAPTAISAQWSIPPNWRDSARANDIIGAMVVAQGTMAFDAGPALLQNMEAVEHQSICSFRGGMAPHVRDVPGTRIVEWTPVIEQNSVDLGGGCTIGASALRGFVFGYNVYRLRTSAFPSPTRREFLVNGYIGHADVLRLNFNVPDPDGMSGSDLDFTDNLTMRNPDGLPDTGDEVLVYTDTSAGLAPTWYRIQPVVRGSQDFFTRGLSSSALVPADRVDLDGDGSLETVDIGQDGFPEFIDPSGRGLGLTWAGEIASSYHPGIGVPPDGIVGCDSEPVFTGETECSDGIDNDGDGPVDCADPDCTFDPNCARETCSNGLDDDSDGLVDCNDSDCAGDPACLAEDCCNLVDDDGDTLIDFADPDCISSPGCPEDCVNGVDDDGDGLIDCFDAECVGTPACPPEICDNGIDDDGDTLADCADLECEGTPACPPEDCCNGLDDDGDTLIDLADTDCVGTPCGGVEDCVNGFDDDGDTLADCLDPFDCCASPSCLVPPPEIGRVDVYKQAIGPDEIVIQWSARMPPAPGATHDVATGCIASRSTPIDPPDPGCLWQDRGFMQAGCLANDVAVATIVDTRAVDPGVFGYYYLVREQDPCGVVGTYGNDSLGRLRLLGLLDCSP